MKRTLRCLVRGLAVLGLWSSLAPARSSDQPVPLPRPELHGTMALEQALQQRRSRREFAAAPLALRDVAQVLWAAQGVTDARGLRTAPSAGALAPLEIYLVAGNVSDLPAGVYRYQPAAHTLAAVQAGDLRSQVTASALGQPALREAPATLLIAGVYSRTRQRYGDRAERYVHIEVGHAAQNIYLQCTARGLATVLIGSFDDAALRAALALPPDHAPLALMPFGRGR